jgi:hypothetical protein
VLSLCSCKSRIAIVIRPAVGCLLRLGTMGYDLAYSDVMYMYSCISFLFQFSFSFNIFPTVSITSWVYPHAVNSNSGSSSKKKRRSGGSIGEGNFRYTVETLIFAPIPCVEWDMTVNTQYRLR